MDIFNNREIATIFWLIILLVWMLLNANIRKSIIELLRAFLHYKIFILFCLMILYVVGVVFLLATIDMWNISLLKDTIVWFCVSALAMMMRFINSNNEESIFRRVLIENLKIVIILEFLVNTYVFSLFVEIVLLPIITLIAMLDAFVSFDKQYPNVAKINKKLLSIIGLAILTIAVIRAISDVNNLGSTDTIRSITLAPLLSMLFIPFIYIYALKASYELVFLRLDFGVEKDQKVKRYARRRIFTHAGLSMQRIRHFLRDHSIDLMHIQTVADVDRMVEHIKDS